MFVTLGSRTSPPTTIVICAVALLATLLRGRLVVAQALFPVRIVMIALVMALQTVGSVVLGTRRRVRVLHDCELRAGQVVLTGTGILVVLLLSIDAPRVVESGSLLLVQWLGRCSGSRCIWVFVYAGDGALTARAC